MTEPKVTLAKWKERINQNAGSNTGATNPQPTSDGQSTGNGTDGSAYGKSAAKSSGNPLHPDITEELARLRDTVLVLKKQIYGSSVPGEIGIVRHIQETEERIAKLEGRLADLVEKFAELLTLLGVGEDSGEAQ